MTDAIEAYNASLEAMAAACEASAKDAQDVADCATRLSLEEQYREREDALRDAAAFIRSQMLRPIADAPKKGRVITLSEWQKPNVDFRPFDGNATHFLPLPQIGDGNE